jgi:hypothetical protein
MTAKAYLRKLDDLDMVIAAKQLLYDEQLTRCTKVNKELEQVSVKTSRDLKKQEEENVKLALIGQEIDELMKLPDEARALFDQLEDNRHCAILTYRHLGGLAWKEIKRLMLYEESWTYELYNRAVDALDEILKDRSLPE